MHREVKQLVKLAERHGFRVEHTRKGHVRFLAPDGVSLVVGAATPSDSRSNKNLLAELRRAGLQDRPQPRPQPVEEQLECGPAVAPQPRPPWAHWTDEQVLHLIDQGYEADFIFRRTGR